MVALNAEQSADTDSQFIRLNDGVQDGGQFRLSGACRHIPESGLALLAELYFLKCAQELFTERIHRTLCENVFESGKKIFPGFNGERQQVKQIRQGAHDRKMPPVHHVPQPCVWINIKHSEKHESVDRFPRRGDQNHQDQAEDAEQQFGGKETVGGNRLIVSRHHQLIGGFAFRVLKDGKTEQRQDVSGERHDDFEQDRQLFAEVGRLFTALLVNFNG